MITLATSENSTILLHPADNVAIARVPLSSGINVRGVVTLTAIAAGHKVAIRAIAKGENVTRYGQFIGWLLLAEISGSRCGCVRCFENGQDFPGTIYDRDHHVRIY